MSNVVFLWQELTGTRVLIPVSGGIVELFATKRVSILRTKGKTLRGNGHRITFKSFHLSPPSHFLQSVIIVLFDPFWPKSTI